MANSPGQDGNITQRRRSCHKITVNGKAVGFTVGGPTLTITVAKEEIYVAEYPKTPVDIDVLGCTLKVAWHMLERSLKTLDIALQGLYPSGYLGAATSRGVGRSGIQRASVIGVPVVLHPVDQGTDTGADINLVQAIITPTGSVDLSDGGSQIFEVEADCIVGASATDGQLLALINEINVGS